jgi:hypothetical protein
MGGKRTLGDDVSSRLLSRSQTHCNKIGIMCPKHPLVAESKKRHVPSYRLPEHSPCGRLNKALNFGHLIESQMILQSGRRTVRKLVVRLGAPI